MANTNGDFNLLNIEQSVGGGTTTIIQQTTDVNLFYTKTATDALLANKADGSTLTSNYYDKTNIDGKISTINNSIATKANTTALDSYYTKSQTDDAIAFATAIGIDISNYYNKATTDDLLATKANQTDVDIALATNANTSAVDTALARKLDTSTYNTNIANYYNKSQVDNLITTVNSGGSVSLDGYYTKTATDALLGNKANSVDVYSKSATDTLLAAKLNTSTYDTSIANYYTKAQTDSLISAIPSGGGGTADLTNYYTKAATNTLLDGKVDKTAINITLGSYLTVDAGDIKYFTQTEINNRLATKQNTTDFNLAILNYYTKDEIGTCYYNKTNIDQLWGSLNTAVGTKANSSDVYTKSQIDTSLLAKQSVSALNLAILNYYTKDEIATSYYDKTNIDGKLVLINTSLGLKANATSVHTKTEVDTIVSSIPTSGSRYTNTQIDDFLALKVNVLSVYDKTYIDTQIANLYLDRCTLTDLQPYLTIAGANDNYNAKLISSAVPSGKTGFQLLNTSANKVRSLYIRNPTGEALELLYDATNDAIVLAMDMTKIVSQANAYTKTESDAKYRLISDSYTKGELYNKTEIDLKTTVLQAGIDTTYTKVESDNKYRLILDSYTKTEINNKLLLKVDTLTLSSYYSRVETDSMLDLKADYNATVLPNFFNKTDINIMLGSYYTTSQIDSAIDQKFTISNAGGDQNQRWFRMGIITYPTNQLGDAKSTIFRISFVQDIAQDTDYYLTIQFKFSSTSYPSSVPVSGVYPPFYGTCNYYVSSNGAYNCPKLVITQSVIALQTIFEFFLDMGYGSPGGVSPSKITMFVNGTAPFVYGGTLVSGPSGGVTKNVTPQVLYSSSNTPPANKINGLIDYIYANAPQKHSHPYFSNQTMFYKLGLLNLPSGGLQAKITLMACRGFDLAAQNMASAPRTPQNYCCDIYVYSGTANNTSGASFILASGSNTSGQTDYGCFHWGFCANNTKWAGPSNVYLCPRISDPTNTVSIWVQSTSFWGTPLIQCCTNGTWYQDVAMSSALPNTGWVILPLQTNTAV